MDKADAPESTAVNLVAFKATDSPLKYLKVINYLAKVYLYRIVESHACIG